MEVKISEKLKEEMPDVKGYGYGSIKEFVEDAIRRRILDLKKAEFLSFGRKVRKRLEEKGFKEEDILEDFKKFSHNK